MARLPAPDGARVLWLVTIEVGARPLRWATDDATITDSIGATTYRYSGCLTGIDVAESLPESGGDVAGISIPVEALLDDAAGRAAAGHTLAMRPAEVAQWVEGTDWAERRVVCLGHVRDPEWGIDGEPVTLSIVARLWDDPTEVPGPTFRVDGTTWPHVETLLPQHLGVPYPIIIGTPGIVSTAVESTGRIEGSRGVWAEYEPDLHASSNRSGIKLIVAGHHVQIGGNGTFGGRIYLRDADGGNEVRVRVRNGYDSRGQPIAWVPWWSEYTSATPPDQFEYNGPATLYQYGPTDTDSAETYGIGENMTANIHLNETTQPVPFLSWLDDIDGGGGMIWRGRLLRNAADVVEWACSQTGQPVDSEAFAALRTSLDRYKIDAVIEGSAEGDRTKIWEWLKTNVLPMLPIGPGMSPRGVSPILWRYTARAADATLILDLDQDRRIGRAGRLKLDTSRITNRFTARYARSLRTGSYVGTLTMGPGPYDSADPRTLVSAHCAESARRYAHPNGRPYIVERSIELPAVYDDGTVTAVLETAAQAEALGIETWALSVPADPYGPRIARGVVALVTDSESHIDGRVALVTDVAWSRDGDVVTIGLRLLPDLSQTWSA